MAKYLRRKSRPIDGRYMKFNNKYYITDERWRNIILCRNPFCILYPLNERKTTKTENNLVYLTVTCSWERGGARGSTF